MNTPAFGLVSYIAQFLQSIIHNGYRFDYDYFFGWTIALTITFIMLKKFLDICHLDSKLFTFTSKWTIAFLYVVAILKETNLTLALGV